MKDITRHHDIFFANRLSLLRIWLCISTLFFTIETSFALNPSRYATQSQLADGYWVKVAVYESGAYTYKETRSGACMQRKPRRGGSVRCN